MEDGSEIAVIKWTALDVKKQFECKYKRKPNEDEIEECVSRIGKTLEERSIEFGWEIISSLI